MAEADIKFEREDREGAIPVGTYLIDAASRLGVRFESGCVIHEKEHYCNVVITQGIDLLSPMTSEENEYFAANEQRTNERLACQARIDEVGELVIMTDEKKKADEQTNDADAKSEQYVKEFADMPLEKKLANLVQLEAIALGETFSFILNSPYMIIDKAMDVMAELGFKKEEEQRRAARPEEHRTEEAKADAEAQAEDSPKEKAEEKPKAAKRGAAKGSADNGEKESGSA